MKAYFLRWLLDALANNAEVQEAIAQIARDTFPEETLPPAHRPISKNTAPGAI